MESIIQQDKSRCYLCGRCAKYGEQLDKHHVFNGAMRGKSERYGLTVYLHHNECHIFGANSVHANAKINRALQADVQKKAMEFYGWTEDDFRRLFYKNYL